MSRTYSLNSPSDLMELAVHVQSLVYWGNTFYLGDNETRTSYREFWAICSAARESGYSRVEISASDDEVDFFH